MKRDFSSSSRSRMIGLIDDVKREKMNGFTDWVGSCGFSVQSWIGRLNINKYFNNVVEYQKNVTNKNDTSRKAVLQSFLIAGTVDATYEGTFSSIIADMKNIDSYIKKMSSIVSPSAGNFSAEFIADTLGNSGLRFDEETVQNKSEAANVEQNDAEDKEPKNVFDDFLFRTEKLGDLLKKIGKLKPLHKIQLPGETIGGIAEYISAGKSFMEAKTKKDAFWSFGDFTKQSGDLYTGTIYKIAKYYVKKKHSTSDLEGFTFVELSDALKKKNGEEFANQFADKHYNQIHVINALTGTYDLAKNIYEVWDEEDTGEKIAKGFDSAKSATQVIDDYYLLSKGGRAAKKLAEEKAKSATGFLGKIGGSMTKVEVGTKIAGSYIDAIGQSVRSYNEYSKDGVFDAIDGSRVAIDGSVKGLSTLSGVTLIEDCYKVFSGDEDADFSKSISTGITNCAKVYSDNIAREVIEDPFLNSVYDMGGPFEGVAIAGGAVAVPVKKVASVVDDAINFIGDLFW